VVCKHRAVRWHDQFFIGVWCCALQLPKRAGMRVSPPTDLVYRPLRGIAFVMLAVLIFACMDVAGKFLLARHDVPFVAGVRYGLNGVLLLAILGPRLGSGLWRTQRTGFVMLRGLSLACATGFAALALQRMPVGETIALMYLQSFGVLLAAGLILGERVGLFGWIAAAVGFAGVVLIARPGGSLPPAGVGFALMCAGVAVIYVLLSRVLAKTETTVAMLFHTALAGIVLFGALLPWHLPQNPITLLDGALLLFMGVASLFGHFLFTAAFRHAPASLLAPLNYFHIAWAVLLGWLVFKHVPDLASIAGMVMIAVSGAAVGIRSQFEKKA
jgi:drug/metabolite transporter (DMT)-like permease